MAIVGTIDEEEEVHDRWKMMIPKVYRLTKNEAESRKSISTILGAQLNELQNCTIEEGIIMYGLPNPPPSLTTHTHFATFIVLNLYNLYMYEG